jgi:hypothetical protein
VLRQAIPQLEVLDANPRSLARAYSWLAASCAELGLGDEAREAAAEARRVAEQSGSIYTMSLCLDLSAYVAVRLGDLDDAELWADRSVELAARAGDQISAAFSLATKGDLLVQLAREQELRPIVDQILRTSREDGAPEQLELLGLRLLALAERHNSRLDLAARVISDLLPHWRDAGQANNLIDGLYLGLAVLADDQNLDQDAASNVSFRWLLTQTDSAAARLGLTYEVLPRFATTSLDRFRTDPFPETAAPAGDPPNPVTLGEHVAIMLRMLADLRDRQPAGTALGS